MAGLAEVRAHIVIFLFWLEFTLKRRESVTVPDTKAYWVDPSLQKIGNTQKRLIQINFTSPAAKISKLNQSLSVFKANILSSSSTESRYKLPLDYQLIYPIYIQI